MPLEAGRKDFLKRPRPWQPQRGLQPIHCTSLADCCEILFFFAGYRHCKKIVLKRCMETPRRLWSSGFVQTCYLWPSCCMWAGAAREPAARTIGCQPWTAGEWHLLMRAQERQPDSCLFAANERAVEEWGSQNWNPLDRSPAFWSSD